MTKKVLLFCQSRDGLYVLSKVSTTSLPQVFSSTCLSTSANVWHHRLGHPGPCIMYFLWKIKRCHVPQINLILIVLRALWASRLVWLLKLRVIKLELLLTWFLVMFWVPPLCCHLMVFAILLFLWMPIWSLSSFILWLLSLMF
jgi:hypothetical protein